MLVQISLFLSFSLPNVVVQISGDSSWSAAEEYALITPPANKQSAKTTQSVAFCIVRNNPTIIAAQINCSLS